LWSPLLSCSLPAWWRSFFHFFFASSVPPLRRVRPLHKPLQPSSPLEISLHSSGSFALDLFQVPWLTGQLWSFFFPPFGTQRKARLSPQAPLSRDPPPPRVYPIIICVLLLQALAADFSLTLPFLLGNNPRWLPFIDPYPPFFLSSLFFCYGLAPKCHFCTIFCCDMRQVQTFRFR